MERNKAMGLRNQELVENIRRELVYFDEQRSLHVSRLNNIGKKLSGEPGQVGMVGALPTPRLVSSITEWCPLRVAADAGIFIHSPLVEVVLTDS
jgi:hypothetical protein